MIGKLKVESCIREGGEDEVDKGEGLGFDGLTQAQSSPVLWRVDLAKVRVCVAFLNISSLSHSFGPIFIGRGARMASVPSVVFPFNCSTFTQSLPVFSWLTPLCARTALLSLKHVECSLLSLINPPE